MNEALQYFFMSWVDPKLVFLAAAGTFTSSNGEASGAFIAQPRVVRTTSTVKPARELIEST